jgi:acyl carrier protein
MKNREFIKSVFNISDKKIKLVNKKTLLTKYNWDSMTILELITKLEEDYNIVLKPKALTKISTFYDLDNFISKLVRKK